MRNEEFAELEECNKTVLPNFLKNKPFKRLDIPEKIVDNKFDVDEVHKKHNSVEDIK